MLSSIDSKITTTMNHSTFISLLAINKTGLNESDLIDFMNTMMNENRQTPIPQLPECQNYCNGDLRDVILEYNENYHGYISLIVSFFNQNFKFINNIFSYHL